MEAEVLDLRIHLGRLHRLAKHGSSQRVSLPSPAFQPRLATDIGEHERPDARLVGYQRHQCWRQRALDLVTALDPGDSLASLKVAIRPAQLDDLVAPPAR